MISSTSANLIWQFFVPLNLIIRFFIHTSIMEHRAFGLCYICEESDIAPVSSSGEVIVTNLFWTHPRCTLFFLLCCVLARTQCPCLLLSSVVSISISLVVLGLLTQIWVLPSKPVPLPSVLLLLLLFKVNTIPIFL